MKIYFLSALVIVTTLLSCNFEGLGDLTPKENIKIADNGVSINTTEKSLTIKFTTSLASLDETKKANIQIYHKGTLLEKAKISSISIEQGQLVIKLVSEVVIGANDTFKVEIPSGVVTDTTGQSNNTKITSPAITLDKVFVQTIAVTKAPTKTIALTFSTNISAKADELIKLYQGQTLLASGKYSVGAITGNNQITFTITDAATSLTGSFRFVFEAEALTLADTSKSKSESFEYSTANLTGPTLASTISINTDTKIITVNLVAPIDSKTDGSIKVYKKSAAQQDYTDPALTSGTGNDYTIAALGQTKNKISITLLATPLINADSYKVLFQAGALTASGIPNSEIAAEIQVSITQSSPDIPTNLTIMAAASKTLKFSKTSEDIVSLSANSVSGYTVEFFDGTTSLGNVTADADGLATLSLTGGSVLSTEKTYNFKAQATSGGQTSTDSSIRTITIDKTNLFLVSNNFDDGGEIPIRFTASSSPYGTKSTNDFPGLAWSGTNPYNNKEIKSYAVLLEDRFRGGGGLIHALFFVPATTTSIDEIKTPPPRSPGSVETPDIPGTIVYHDRWVGPQAYKHEYHVTLYLIGLSLNELKANPYYVNQGIITSKETLDNRLKAANIISTVSTIFSSPPWTTELADENIAPPAPESISVFIEDDKELLFRKTHKNIVSLKAQAEPGVTVEFFDDDASLGSVTADVAGLATLSLTGGSVLSAEKTYKLNAKSSYGGEINTFPTRAQWITIDKTSSFVASNSFEPGKLIGGDRWQQGDQLNAAYFDVRYNDWLDLTWNVLNGTNKTPQSYVVIIDDTYTSGGAEETWVHATLYIPKDTDFINYIKADKTTKKVTFPTGITGGRTSWYSVTGYEASAGIGWGGYGSGGDDHTYTVEVFLTNLTVTQLEQGKDTITTRAAFRTAKSTNILGSITTTFKSPETPHPALPSD